MQDNRIKKALELIKSEGVRRADELDTPAKAALWERMKREMLNDLIVKYNKGLTEEEKVSLRFAKAERLDLQKKAGVTRVRRFYNRVWNIIRRPVLKRIWTAQASKDQANISAQLHRMNIQINPQRLSRYLESKQVPSHSRVLPDGRMVEMDFNTGKGGRNVSEIKSVDLKILSTEPGKPAVTFNLDFSKTGTLDVQQLVSLAQGKPVLQEGKLDEEWRPAVWLKIEQTNGTAVLRQIPYDRAFEKQVSDLPVNFKTDLNLVVNDLKKGMEPSLFLQSGKQVQLSADPFKKEDMLAVKDKAGKELDKEHLITPAIVVPITTPVSSILDFSNGVSKEKTNTIHVQQPTPKGAELGV
jgi:hypothetical protein